MTCWTNVADMRLIDRRSEDGSRHFASLPKSCTWHALRNQILLLPGSQVLNFVVEGAAEAWMEFAYRDQRFRVSDGNGKYCFSVCDPQCPDLRLYQVASHCENLLGRT